MIQIGRVYNQPNCKGGAMVITEIKTYLMHAKATSRRLQCRNIPTSALSLIECAG